MIKNKVNFLQLICRDLKLAFRQIGDIFSVLFFFIIVQISIPIKIHESTPDTVTKYQPPIIPAIIISAIQ